MRKNKVIQNILVWSIPILSIISSANTINISGESMKPLINDGDVVYTLPVKKINTGEIVIAEVENGLVIKRLYGVPGDVVEIKENKIIINNKLVKVLEYQIEDYSKVLSNTEYFLVGDNPNTEVIITDKIYGKVEGVISREGK